MSDQLKRCPYCKRLHPADDLVIRHKGKFGRTKVAQCKPCYEARKNPEAFKNRLDDLIAHQTKGKVRDYLRNRGDLKNA